MASLGGGTMSDNDPKRHSSKPLPKSDVSVWRQLLMLAGFTVQVPMSILAFGLIGQWAGTTWHIPWLMEVGVFVGLLMGVTGLITLIKKVNGGA